MDPARRARQEESRVSFRPASPAHWRGTEAKCACFLRTDRLLYDRRRPAGAVSSNPIGSFSVPHLTADQAMEASA